MSDRFAIMSSDSDSDESEYSVMEMLSTKDFTPEDSFATRSSTSKEDSGALSSGKMSDTSVGSGPNTGNVDQVSQDKLNKLVERVIWSKSYDFLDEKSKPILIPLLKERAICLSDKEPIDSSASIVFVLSGEVSVHDQTGNAIAALTAGDTHGHADIIFSKRMSEHATTYLSSSRNSTTCAVLKQDEINKHLPLLPALLLLRNNSLLTNLPYVDRSYIATNLLPRVFTMGQFIIEKNTSSPGVFIIVSGRCKISEEVKSYGEKDERVITKLLPGHIFGEMSLLPKNLDRKYANTNVIADSNTVKTCFFSFENAQELLLRSEEFNSKLKEEIDRKFNIKQKRMSSIVSGGAALARSESMQRITEHQEKNTRQVRHSHKVIRIRSDVVGPENDALGKPAYASTNVKNRKSLVVINGYVCLHTLGKGSFGKVKLVEKNGEFYAMKIISRSILKRYNKLAMRNHGQQNVETQKEVEAVMMEVALMKQMHHVNVVGLVEVLDDPNHELLYIVSEYCAGGEVMRRKSSDDNNRLVGSPLEPSLAYKYTRHLIRGITYCHSQGIVHRDLKPENLLLDLNGVLKIADFGCSEISDIAGKVSTVKGTPAFMAPELLLQKSKINGYACDLYSVGSCIYMFHEGRPPYYERNEIEMVERIRRNVPPSYSHLVRQNPNLLDLLQGLLKINPGLRLKIQDVITHPYTTNEGSSPLYPTPEDMRAALQRQHIDLNPKDYENAISMATLSYTVKMRSVDWLRRARTRIKYRKFQTPEADDSLLRPRVRRKIITLKWCACCQIVSEETNDNSKLKRSQLLSKKQDSSTNYRHSSSTSVSDNLTDEKPSKEHEKKHVSSPSSSETDDDDFDDGMLLTGQSALDTIVDRPIRSKYSVVTKPPFDTLLGKSSVKENDSQVMDTTHLDGSQIRRALKHLSFGLHSSKTVCDVNEDRACAHIDKNCKIFGVFDGHNGDFVSEMLSKHLIAEIIESIKQESEPMSSSKESMFMRLFEREDCNIMSCLLKGFETTRLEEDHDLYDTAEPKNLTDSSEMSSKEMEEMALIKSREIFSPGSSFRKSLIRCNSDTNESKSLTGGKSHSGRRPPTLRRHSSLGSPLQGFSNLSSAPGSTASIVLILHDSSGKSWMHIAWVGDSRVVMSSSNGRVVVLSEDHRASNPNEERRMKRVGGIVSRGRTFGSLQLSRSFGDPAHKEHFLRKHFPTRYPLLIKRLTPKARRLSASFQEESKENLQRNEMSDAVISTPSYVLHEVLPSDEFVIIASDGFFDVVSNEEAIIMARRLISGHTALSDVAKELVNYAVAQGTEDNTTVVIVALN